MKKFYLCFLVSFCLPTVSFAEDVFEELPAGGIYVFQNGNDKFTIKCTATPEHPKVVTKSCGCFGSPRHIPYSLNLNIVYDNGKTVTSTLTNTETQSECEAKINTTYTKACMD